MPTTFMIGCLELKKRRFCEIPFQKSIVLSDVVFDKLGQRYKPFFPRKNTERLTVKVADGHSHCQFFKK